MNNPALQINNLTKNFKKTVALDNLSLSVGHGEVFCLLGPNGSGKTTMINCVLSLLRPDSGQIKIFGLDNCIAMNHKTGVVLEKEGFFEDMTVEKNMEIICKTKRCPTDDVQSLLEKVSLHDFKNKTVKKLSQGQKKRLSIAGSLIGNPDLIIWDEPYNSLDPDGFLLVRDILSRLQDNRKTVLLATHLLDEAEKVATHIGLLYKGRIIKTSTMREIKESYRSTEEFFFANISE